MALLTGQLTHHAAAKAARVEQARDVQALLTGTCEVCVKALRGSGIVYWQG